MVYKYLATLGVENQNTPFRVGLGLMLVGLILPPHFFKLNIASPPPPLLQNKRMCTNDVLKQW